MSSYTVLDYSSLCCPKCGCAHGAPYRLFEIKYVEASYLQQQDLLHVKCPACGYVKCYLPLDAKPKDNI